MEGSPTRRRRSIWCASCTAGPPPPATSAPCCRRISTAPRKTRRLLCSEGIRIRLCKGAYKEPASIAYPEQAGRGRELHQGGQADPQERSLSRTGNPRRKHHRRHQSLGDAGGHRRRRPSSSRCCTGCGAICRRAWREKDGACAVIFRSARSGIRTSCAGWRSVRRTCCSWRRTTSRARRSTVAGVGRLFQAVAL